MFRRSWMTGIPMLLAAGVARTQNHAPPPPPPPSGPRRPASPPGTAATQVGGKWSAPDKEGEQRYSGGKWIEVTYSRPILRGRTEIFGKGADYGKRVNAGGPVWRAGANVTTRLKTEVPLEIAGKKIEPGEYSLFVDLKEGGWTLIVSTQGYQEKYDPKEKARTWGAFNYDPKDDVVRAPMKMVTPAVTIEQFTIGFVNMTDKGGALAMGWEKTGALVPARPRFEDSRLPLAQRALQSKAAPAAARPAPVQACLPETGPPEVFESSPAGRPRVESFGKQPNFRVCA
jgi:hypothetical protein